jgi:beta-lactamase class C
MTPSATRFACSSAIIAASCLLPLACQAADQGAAIRPLVDAVVKPMMAEHDLPGMAVAVTVGGKAYVFNYGLASREKNLPVTDATMFELGSITKPLVATLGTYAQVLGKLALDDHPGKFMPELKGSAIDKATLLHLATYTAGGLPLQVPDEVAPGQMVNYFQQWKPEAAPGVQRRYSNPSIGLFGHVVALSLQSDFADAMERKLFPQLGLRNTYIRVPQAALANYAWGYDSANKPARVAADILSAEAYGVVSSAADIIRFVQANIEPAMLEGPMRRAVEGTQVGYFAVGGMVQGLGWEQYSYPIALADLVAGNSPAMSQAPNPARRIDSPKSPSQAILFNKSGSTRGFGNYVAFVPAKKIGVVILANKGSPAPARVKAAHTILVQLERLGQ